MAIDLSSTRIALNNQITHYLESNNPSCLNSWLPTLFVSKKSHHIMNDISQIIGNIINSKCIYEFSDKNDVNASFFDNQIKIIVPENFFYRYIDGFISDYWIPTLVGQIVDITLHELVHREQVNAGFIHPSKKKIPAHWLGPIAYFAQQHEIEAWAIYVSSELIRKYNSKQILNMLSSKSDIEILSSKSKMLEKYFKLFYQNKIIWRRFIKKICHHIQTNGG